MGKKSRNDRGLQQQGQGNRVLQLLPPERDTTVRARRIAATETEVARCDAAIFIIDEARWSSALKRVPFARIWTRLDKQQGPTAETPWLVSRLPTARQTLGVVGRWRTGGPAFERL